MGRNDPVGIMWLWTGLRGAVDDLEDGGEGIDGGGEDMEDGKAVGDDIMESSLQEVFVKLIVSPSSGMSLKQADS